MKAEITRKVTLTAGEVEQAIHEFLIESHRHGSLDGPVSCQFNIRGGSLDTAYDTGQIFDGCTVTILESEDDS